MDKENITNLGTNQKKELVHTLLSSLMEDLDEIEKKKLVLEVVSSNKENIQAIDMVDH